MTIKSAAQAPPGLEENVLRITTILPHITKSTAKNSLIVSQGNLVDALLLLSSKKAPEDSINVQTTQMDAQSAVAKAEGDKVSPSLIEYSASRHLTL